MKKRMQFAFLLLSSSQLLAEVSLIQWNYNNEASAVGEGCNMDNTAFIQAGNEITVIFNDLGVSLSGHADGRTRHQKFCKLVIPAKIEKGHYFSQLAQTLSYGFVRTENTDGEVRIESSFLGKEWGMRETVKPQGHRHKPFAQMKVQKRFEIDRDVCNTPYFRTQFKAKITVSGERKTLQDEIIMQIDGLDLRFDALGEVLPCIPVIRK